MCHSAILGDIHPFSTPQPSKAIGYPCLIGSLQEIVHGLRCHRLTRQIKTHVTYGEPQPSYPLPVAHKVAQGFACGCHAKCPSHQCDTNGLDDGPDAATATMGTVDPVDDLSTSTYTVLASPSDVQSRRGS